MTLLCRLLLFLFCSGFTTISIGQEISQLQKKLDTTKDPKLKAKILSDIGMYYFKKQIYYDSAFFYTEKSWKLAKANQMKFQELRTLFNLATINNVIGENEKSIENYESVINLLSNEKPNAHQASTYNNLGGVYFEIEKYHKAIENYQKSLEISKEIESSNGIGIAHLNIGEAYYKLNKLNLSKEYIEKAIAIISPKNDFATVHLFYSRTLFALGNNLKAKEEALKALAISEKENDIKYFSESTLLLSKIFEKDNMYAQAYKYHKQHLILKDSINEAKEFNELEKLRLNFELRDKNEALEYLSQKNKYQNIIWLLAVLGVLLLIILIFRQLKIIRMTKNIHDIQKRLVETELDIREQQNKKYTSFQATKEQDNENGHLIM